MNEIVYKRQKNNLSQFRDKALFASFEGRAGLWVKKKEEKERIVSHLE